MNHESWEMFLAQATQKEHEKMPDFLGDTVIAGTPYEVAAWFNEVSKGNNAGRPYIGLALATKGNASSQKINISLWEKPNRKTADEPHFRTREELSGRKLSFSVWVEPAGEFYTLRIRIEPATAEAMSDAAQEVHERLGNFLKTTSPRLTSGGIPKTERSRLKGNPPKSHHKPAGDLEAEPDEIPF